MHMHMQLNGYVDGNHCWQLKCHAGVLKADMPAAYAANMHVKVPNHARRAGQVKCSVVLYGILAQNCR